MTRTIRSGVVLAVLCSLPLSAQGPVKIRPAKPLQSARVDLNGDGKPEDIRLYRKKEPSEFDLVINDKVRISDRLDGEIDGFEIVDIDRKDRFREVAVHTEGPSDDDQYLYFWYDGVRLQKSGLLARWPKYLGNGIVLVQQWEGFWGSQNKFVLRKDHTLAEVPQEFYSVGCTPTVRRPLGLLQRRNGTPLANLRVGSKITVLLGDKKGWFLVQSENDLVGWVREEDLLAKVEGLPIAD